MKDLKKTNLLKKIFDSEGLPSLSPLTIRLIELAADDRSSAKDLALIIEKDPGLTARLLKLVGSAFFSRSEPVHSIGQAVVLLGFKRVRIMALSLSLRDTFPMGTRDGMDFDHFWNTSLYRALIAQDFARAAKTNGLNSDEAFVGGLILEIGMLLLYEACPGEMKKGFPRRSIPLEKAISWEEKNLGINHREVGSLIMKRWHFSEHLTECQRCFGPDALAPDIPVLGRIVELARRATEVVFDRTADLYEFQQLIQDLLKLDSDSINGILSEAFVRVENMADQLRIKVNSQADILRVMEEANQALARINVSMDASLQGFLDHVNQYDRPLARISEEMNRGREDILQNTLDAVAHEIRNPLLAIGGFARRLATRAGEQDLGRQYAKIIAEESRRLEWVLKEIMDYSRAYDPCFAETEVCSFMDKILYEFKDLFREKRIDVVRDFPHYPARVSMDQDGMTKVLRQLIRNAVSMIDQARGTIIISIQPMWKTGQISIRISDNGHPLPDDIRDALLDSNLSTKTFGKGLGFPMARKIIEAHNGRIELKSNESGGNNISFHIPISQSPTSVQVLELAKKELFFDSYKNRGQANND